MESVLHTLRCTSTYTLLYIVLLLGVQEIPTYRPDKKETQQTWISSIALDLSFALETREERRDDRRRSRDRTCSAETRRMSQKAKSLPPIKSQTKKKKQRPKEKKTRALSEGRYPAM